MRSKPGQTLSSTATNAHQETMTTWLLDHTGDSRDMLNSKPKIRRKV